jgi:Peptidase MA superfamily
VDVVTGPGVRVMGRVRRATGLLVMWGAVGAILVATAGSARAVVPYASWIGGSASATPAGVDFRQQATVRLAPTRAEIVIDLPGRIPLVDEVLAPGGGTITLTYQLMAEQVGLFPFTRVEARWRLTFGATTVELGPPAGARYEGVREPWEADSQAVHGVTITVHAYGQPPSIATEALSEAARGMTTAEEAFGVHQTRPVEVVLYPSQEDFGRATGATPDFAGLTDPLTNNVYLVVEGHMDEEAASTVRHELTHVVFHAAFGEDGRLPPLWLNEGAASYLMDLFGGSWFRGAISAAARSGGIIPLERLTATFPSVSGAITLAYEEGASAVEYLVRTYGDDALPKLAADYRAGMTDDEAFRAALGVDVAGFEHGWLESIHARDLLSYGPRPAVTGPPSEPPGFEPAPAAGSGSGGLPRWAASVMLLALAGLLFEIQILRMMESRRAAVRPQLIWAPIAATVLPAATLPLPSIPIPPPPHRLWSEPRDPGDAGRD